MAAESDLEGFAWGTGLAGRRSEMTTIFEEAAQRSPFSANKKQAGALPA